MTAQTPQQRHPLIYGIYRVLVIPSLVCYSIFLWFILTSEQGEVMQYTRLTQYVGIFIVTPLTMLMGYFIMRRVEGNVVGPALIVMAVFINAEMIYALKLPIWQSSLNQLWLSLAMLPAFYIIVTHYPTGRIYPQKLSSIIYGAIGLTTVLLVLTVLGQPDAYGTEFAYGEAQANLLFVPQLYTVATLAENLTFVVSLIFFPLIILLQIYRYIKAKQSVRKQIRWLIFAMIIALPATVIQSNLSILVFTAFLPVGFGGAILFSGLWDIDVIIRRTLIYSVVSGLLALTYFTIVLTAQTLLSGFIPQDNTLLIVVSTLAVAALFNPVLQRVQSVIDRIFYRKRYDAEATLQQFSEKIRDAVDARTIEQEVVKSITSTIQPESISLWVVEQSPKP